MKLTDDVVRRVNLAGPGPGGRASQPAGDALEDGAGWAT